ncbi:MAG: hypothetical protein RLZZ129_2259 [Verrucomicrobiota bacterium]|jgi:DNA-binding transcriptional regulator GbsR (MarR family)
MTAVPHHASLPVGTSEAQKAFQVECTERFAGLAQLFGLPRSVGQIYGILFASPRPLSFTDVVQHLGISKGSASQGLRALWDVRAILLTASIDDRRDRYVPETELRKLIAGFLRGSIMSHLQEGTVRLEEFKVCHAAALASEGAEGRLLLDRLGKLQTWQRKGKAVLPLISKLLG